MLWLVVHICMIATILPEELDRQDKWEKKREVVVPVPEYDLQHGLVK